MEAEKGMDSVTRLFTLSVLWSTCQVPVPWGHSAGKMLSICRSGTWGLEWPIRWDLGFWVHWDSQPAGSQELQSCGQSSLDASQSSTGWGRKTEVHEGALSVGKANSRETQTTYTDSMEVLGKISLGSRWDVLAHSPSPPLPHPHLLLWGKVTCGESVPRATAQPFQWHLLPSRSFFMLKLSCFWLFGFSSKQPYTHWI